MGAKQRHSLVSLRWLAAGVLRRHDAILLRLKILFSRETPTGSFKKLPSADTGWSRGASHEAVRLASDRARSAERAVLMADGLFTSVKCRSVTAFRQFVSRISFQKVL